MSPKTRSVLSLLVLVLALACASEPPAPAVEVAASDLAACKAVVSIFDPLELPDVRDKKLVVYNDPGIWTQLREGFPLGWVVAETDEEVTLFENYPRLRTYKKTSVRPPSWEQVKDLHGPNALAPGERREIDFGALCKAYLEKTESAFAGQGQFRLGGLSRQAQVALIARWAWQRGDRAAAMAFSKLVTPTGVSDEIARHLWRAVFWSKSVAERLTICKRIVRLAPGTDVAREAGNVGIEYEMRLAEEKTRTRLSSDEVAALSTSARAEYLCRELSDVFAFPLTDSGLCSVIRGDNAAWKLVAMGWDALPAVIERLDDSHLTLSFNYWTSGPLRNYYFLRVADCARQVFERITGVDLADGHADPSRGWAKATRRARELWAEWGTKGPEKFFSAQLASESPSACARAAEALLQIDAMNLPRVLEALGKMTGAAKVHVLWVVGPSLTKNHEKLLEHLLEDDDLEVVDRAAHLLWERCGSDAGARRLVPILEKWTAEDTSSPLPASAVRLFTAIGNDYCRDAVCRFIRESSEPVRVQAIANAWAFVDPTVVEALLPVLDDATVDSRYVRNCDYAARSIARIVHQPLSFRDKPAAERDRMIRELKAWWAEHKSTLDWSELRRLAAEERKP